MTRETVEIDTPASLATSRTLGMADGNPGEIGVRRERALFDAGGKLFLLL